MRERKERKSVGREVRLREGERVKENRSREGVRVRGAPHTSDVARNDGCNR